MICPSDPGSKVPIIISLSAHLTCEPLSGSLIYEYIGEVVQEKTFRKRMQQYADEGIRHFYFMMLQKEEVRLIPFPHLTVLSRPGSYAALHGKVRELG